MYFKTPIRWEVAIPLTLPLLVGFYGLILVITGETQLKTIVFIILLDVLFGLGLTVGAHRLFTHRSFEANKVVRLILLYLFSFSGQLPLYEWVRIHRIHHEYADTEADPLNPNRGIFFSHFGWVLLEKTKEFEEKGYRLAGLGEEIDMSDLERDQAIMFHKKYFLFVTAINICTLTFIPWFFWNETLVNSLSTIIFGIFVLLNQTCLINSVSHSWGWKPYDTTIEPTFSRLIAYLTLGEGYHNFHHAFPFDYSGSEFKCTEIYNPATLVIDVMEYFGWVRNKREANPELIQKRRLRTGDSAVSITPKWGVLLDYLFGIVVLAFPMWVILSLRFAFKAAT